VFGNPNPFERLQKPLTKQPLASRITARDAVRRRQRMRTLRIDGGERKHFLRPRSQSVSTWPIHLY
ncbi:hypothetical protein, partial [Halomonas sp. IOP_31]|uniref:hypothetical protein n=1 Tax=Halomonas sp. IOP_31 TaxID=2876584 RepID=UPI001E483A35